MDLTFTWSQLFATNFQFFAFITGILSVALLLPTRWPKLQYWAWPTGVATSVSYFFLFYDWQLYGSTILQVWFVVTCLIGAWLWRGQAVGREVKESTGWLGRLFGASVIPTQYATLHYVATTILISLLSFIPVYLLLGYYNDASPTWDGLILVLSGAAIWLQLKKFVQSWPIWIVVDIIAIPLYASQGNGGTALLYIAYMVMCFVGWYTWRNAAKEQSSPTVLSDYDDLEPYYA